MVVKLETEDFCQTITINFADQLSFAVNYLYSTFSTGVHTLATPIAFFFIYFYNVSQDHLEIPHFVLFDSLAWSSDFFLILKYYSAYLHHLAQPRFIFGLSTIRAYFWYLSFGSTLKNSTTSPQPEHRTSKTSPGFLLSEICARLALPYIRPQLCCLGILQQPGEPFTRPQLAHVV